MAKYEFKRGLCKECGVRMSFAWPSAQDNPANESIAPRFQQCRNTLCEHDHAVVDTLTGQIWFIDPMPFAEFVDKYLDLGIG